MRIAQMVFVRVFVLEHLLAKVALNFIVRCVDIPHVSVELRGTDVFVTFLTVNFACKSTQINIKM